MQVYRPLLRAAAVCCSCVLQLRAAAARCCRSCCCSCLVIILLPEPCYRPFRGTLQSEPPSYGAPPPVRLQLGTRRKSLVTSNGLTTRHQTPLPWSTSYDGSILRSFTASWRSGGRGGGARARASLRVDHQRLLRQRAPQVAPRQHLAARGGAAVNVVLQRGQAARQVLPARSCGSGGGCSDE